VSSKAMIAILSRTRPIARMLSSLSIYFSPPAPCQRAHRSLARLGIAVRRRAILMIAESSTDAAVFGRERAVQNATCPNI
jgi:hypothetical protein